MLCPYCGEENNRVIQTYQRPDDNAIDRVRRCMCCGASFVTVEREVQPDKKKNSQIYT